MHRVFDAPSSDWAAEKAPTPSELLHAATLRQLGERGQTRGFELLAAREGASFVDVLVSHRLDERWITGAEEELRAARRGVALNVVAHVDSHAVATGDGSAWRAVLRVPCGNKIVRRGVADTTVLLVIACDADAAPTYVLLPGRAIMLKLLKRWTDEELDKMRVVPVRLDQSMTDLDVQLVTSDLGAIAAALDEAIGAMTDPKPRDPIAPASRTWSARTPAHLLSS